jgi:hypothetical protein
LERSRAELWAVASVEGRAAADQADEALPTTSLILRMLGAGNTFLMGSRTVVVAIAPELVDRVRANSPRIGLTNKFCTTYPTWQPIRQRRELLKAMVIYESTEPGMVLISELFLIHPDPG